ncbi:MAG: hypothetical protein JKY51_01765 [Opitutaceae bacterium]|nr:hypothetical protein [Opitutaceae bacterium]
MSVAVLFAFACVVLCLLTVVAVLLRNKRSIIRWVFALGMFALMIESLCIGLSAIAESPYEVFYWQRIRFTAMTFLPGAWLFFSLNYARGNAQRKRGKRRYA